MSQGYTGPPQSSGGGGTVVVIILVILGVLGLGCLGVCGLGFFGFAWTAQQASQQIEHGAAMTMESFDASMNEAVLRATATTAIASDARVKEALGEPINFEGAGDQAHAANGEVHSFDMPLSGPKANATAHVEGNRNAGGWEITVLQVRLADGDTIEVNPNQSFPVPLDGEATPTLPSEITDPSPSPDPVPSETTP